MSNLKELFEGLKPISETDNGDLVKELRLTRIMKDISQEINANNYDKQTEGQMYFIQFVPRDFGKNVLLADYLSLEHAQEIVQADIERNPKAEDYMVSFYKQNH